MSQPTPASVTFMGSLLQGIAVSSSTKRVVDLAGVFANDDARAKYAADAIAYSVQMHAAIADGTAGGLFFGISTIESGVVGDEYFMTRGHFHSKADRGEYYWGIEGSGLLALMTRDRVARVEIVQPGSLHYIPGHTAHRLVNSGDTQLCVGACWPSDAGHDYESIAKDGFSIRVFKRDGKCVIEDVG